MAYIDIHSQLAPLDLNGLRNRVREQEARLANLNNTIQAANARIAELRKAAAPPPIEDMRPDERQLFRNVQERQLASQIIQVRRDTDTTLVPVLKAINAASDDARVMAERHWDKYSVLRRATAGNGVQDALARRAYYADILAVAGSVELANFAQDAVDRADGLLADCILRENGARKRDEQSFMNQRLLDLIVVEDYDKAQAALRQVQDIASKAGLAYSEFQRQAPDAFRRIQMGLKMRADKMEMAEDGSVVSA